MEHDETDYKFEYACSFDRSYETALKSVKTPELSDIAETFARNLDRITSLGALPIELTYWSGQFSLIKSAAAHSAGYSPMDTTADTDPTVEIEERQLVEQYNARLDADPQGSLQRAWSIGSHNFEAMVRHNTLLAPGLEAIMAAMLIDGWMAFESTSADLWRTSVNICPDPLASNTIKAQSRRSNARDTASEESLRVEKSLQLGTISSYGFDLRSVMGDVLERTGKISFVSLKDIRHAYKAAFGSVADNIFKSRPELSYLEALRNLFAHRGGLIDRTFLSRVSGHPGLSALEIGTLLKPDGPLVCQHLDAVGHL